MTLLKRLEKALNKLDGRYSNIYEEIDVGHKDQYKCSCGEIVPGDEWNEEYKCCRDCYMELAEDHNVPPFEGINEYQLEGDI
jgi:hypothetical protein